MKKVITLMIFLIAVNFSHSQKGGIKGKITDAETGEFIPMVRVVLKKADTVFAVTHCDLEGRFVFEDLSPGIYGVEMRPIGYQKAMYEGITVSANIIAKVDHAFKERVLISCCFGGCRMPKFKNPAVP